MSIKRVALADLGWCIAKLSIDEDGTAESLIIISPADTSQDRYAPAESVCLFGRKNIDAFKNFLDTTLHAAEQTATAPDIADQTEADNPPVRVP